MGKKDLGDLFDLDGKGFGLVRDTDSDNVADFLDCQPLNPSKQDSKKWFSGKALGSVGYDVDDATARRRKALRKMIRALQRQGMTKAQAAYKTWAKLNGLYITWSNQSGYQQSDITAVCRDRDWISKEFRMER